VKKSKRGLQSSRTVTILLTVLTIWQTAGCAVRSPNPDPKESIRPRIGQVVDADTGKPLVGALVLEVFYRWPKRGFGNFPVSKVFRDSAETFTDSGGRFILSGPFDSDSWWTDALYIFKSGYGPWRFRGQVETAPVTQTAGSQWSFLQQTWDAFTTAGVVIELRPLRTRSERLKYIDQGWAPGDVLEPGFRRETPFDPIYFFGLPAELLTRFQSEVDLERANLGLPRRQLDGHRQRR